MKFQSRPGIAKTGAAVVILGLFVVGLVGSVALQVTGAYSNPVGQYIENLFGGAKSLSVEGCLFNSDGSVIQASCQTNSGAAIPLASITPPGGGGGGSCTSTTKGVGWGMSAVPTFTGTASSITFSGSEVVTFNGATIATIPVSYTVNNPVSGQSYSIKSLTADLSSSSVLGTTNCVAGSYSFSMSAPVTMTINFADGSSLTKTATASGSMSVSVSTADSITGLSVTATGSSF